MSTDPFFKRQIRKSPPLVISISGSPFDKGTATSLRRQRKLTHEVRCARDLQKWNNREHPALSPPKKMRRKAHEASA